MAIPTETKTVVLYVEDDALTRESVGKRLQRRGFGVLTAESGEQALEIVTDQPSLHAVLLDLGLPGMDGLETYKRLLASYPNLPAVICSGALTPSLKARFEELGVADEYCLTKPVSFDQLLAVLQQATVRPT